MKVEILYYDGCPTYKTAVKTLQEILAEQSTETQLRTIAVNTDEQAQQLRFQLVNRGGSVASPRNCASQETPLPLP